MVTSPGRPARLLCLLACLLPLASSLKCFVCNNQQSNEECSRDEHLRNCDDLAESSTTKYDACQTIVNTLDGHVLINKKCVMTPCTLDKNQNKALDLECTGNECSSCCLEDGCNVSAAPALARPALALLVLGALLVL